MSYWDWKEEIDRQLMEKIGMRVSEAIPSEYLLEWFDEEIEPERAIELALNEI